MIVTPQLDQQLQLAMQSVQYDGAEEEGGFILKREDEYLFVKVKNANTGTEVALVLFTADRAEFGTKVIPHQKDGWIIWASFHSHPGNSVMPSSTDLTKLFKGFPNNFIYSPKSKKLNWYQYRAEKSAWVYQILQ